jgi:hypothetical protein
LPFLSSAPWNMIPVRSFMGIIGSSDAAAAASESSDRYGSSTRA